MVTTVFTEGCNISASFFASKQKKKALQSETNVLLVSLHFPLLHITGFCDWSREWGVSRMWNWEWRVGNVELGMESEDWGVVSKKCNICMPDITGV